jgi:hypothetical protein
MRKINTSVEEVEYLKEILSELVVNAELALMVVDTFIDMDTKKRTPSAMVVKQRLERTLQKIERGYK